MRKTVVVKMLEDIEFIRACLCAEELLLYGVTPHQTQKYIDDLHKALEYAHKRSIISSDGCKHEHKHENCVTATHARVYALLSQMDYDLTSKHVEWWLRDNREYEQTISIIMTACIDCINCID
jgi:hypothetical protein